VRVVGAGDLRGAGEGAGESFAAPSLNRAQCANGTRHQSRRELNAPKLIYRFVGSLMTLFQLQ
jgi:hypothetical protein